MTPESSRFLAKAREHLERAAVMLRVGLPDDAGRAAYLAAFHAAQAFIFEGTGKVIKTHNGVQAEFMRQDQGRSTLYAQSPALFVPGL